MHSVTQIRELRKIMAKIQKEVNRLIVNSREKAVVITAQDRWVYLKHIITEQSHFSFDINLTAIFRNSRVHSDIHHG